jgi:nitrite reductase/ring-hydroxylating ferredoxin subunit
MRFYIFTIIFVILLFGCKKEKKHPVPDIPVYETINIYDAEYNNLLNPYGIVTIKNSGFEGNGIIVVNLGNNEFMAYDATCTYEVKKDCKVSPDPNSMTIVKCNCCGTKYEVTYGSVSEGIAGYPLKNYKTSFDGEYLRIYN